MHEVRYQELPDEELLRLSLEPAPSRQAEECWRELFERYRARLALWCLRYAGDREEAADLAQEVLFRAWHRRAGFQEESRFSTWLYAICRNHCLNHVKAKQSRIREQVVDDLPSLAAEAPAPERALDESRRQGLARTWIRELLNEQERLVMSLHYGQELPLDAVTRLLGLNNASGAKALVVSAKRKLQAAARAWRGEAEGDGNA